MKMTEIYYIEDDASIAQSVKEYLERYDFRVTVYHTAAGARMAMKQMCPQLVLLDWNLPDGQGDRLCRFIRAQWSELPIIFLTVRGDAKDIVAGFGDGADDYVVKPFELAVLHSRILALLRRAGQSGQARLYCDGITLDRDRKSVYLGKEELALSMPEYEILLMFMENKGKTILRGQFLEQVWDSSGNYVNDNTLTVTMKRLREKLHQPACIKTVRSFGYRMEDTL